MVISAREVRKAARAAELESKTGATGLTLLHMQSGWETSPVARLVDTKQIGPEELAAAKDISTAFLSMAGALMVRGQTWERVDKGMDGHEPVAIIDAQRRYRTFAEHWSRRRGWGDRTLQIIIEAVVDERPLYLIDGGLSLRHGTAKQATIRGLRDYAVRAGWVRGVIGMKWKLEAELTFPRARHPNLLAAIAKARTRTTAVALAI